MLGPRRRDDPFDPDSRTRHANNGLYNRRGVAASERIPAFEAAASLTGCRWGNRTWGACAKGFFTTRPRSVRVPAMSRGIRRHGIPRAPRDIARATPKQRTVIMINEPMAARCGRDRTRSERSSSTPALLNAAWSAWSGTCDTWRSSSPPATRCTSPCVNAATGRLTSWSCGRRWRPRPWRAPFAKPSNRSRPTSRATISGRCSDRRQVVVAARFPGIAARFAAFSLRWHRRSTHCLPS